MPRLLLVITLLALPLFAAGQAYRIVHPDGTVEFTDEPAPSAERIDLPPVTTYPAPPAPQSAEPAAPAAKPQPKPSITVTQPAAGETFWVSDWQVPARVVVAGVDKDREARVELLVDGAPMAAGTGPEFVLQPVYRGEHRVTARLLDAQGRELARSQPVTFYVHKHSIQR